MKNNKTHNTTTKTYITKQKTVKDENNLWEFPKIFVRKYTASQHLNLNCEREKWEKHIKNFALRPFKSVNSGLIAVHHECQIWANIEPELRQIGQMWDFLRSFVCTLCLDDNWSNKHSLYGSNLSNLKPNSYKSS